MSVSPRHQSRTSPSIHIHMSRHSTYKHFVIGDKETAESAREVQHSHDPSPGEWSGGTQT